MDLDSFDGDMPRSSVLSPLWKLVPQVLTGLIFFVIIGIMLTAFRPQLAEQALLDAEIERLSLAKKHEAKKKEVKTQQLAWLKVDKEYMETQARDLIGSSLSQETVLEFNDQNEFTGNVKNPAGR